MCAKRLIARIQKKENGRRNVFGRIVRMPLAAESLTGEVLPASVPLLDDLVTKDLIDEIAGDRIEWPRSIREFGHVSVCMRWLSM